MYGIYYFGVSEGYIKVKLEGEKTTFQKMIGFFTPMSPPERLIALSRELVGKEEELRIFQEQVEDLQAGRIT
jgi:hypothetical protein